MDEMVKNSIDSRKSAIMNAYALNSDEQKEVDDLFVKIENLGLESSDVGDFEAKFAASPLNTEYMNLFTKIATSQAQSDNAKGLARNVAKGVAEGMVRDAVGASIPTTRAAVHQKVYDEVRDVPVVGEALGIKQHLDFLNKFRRKGE